MEKNIQEVENYCQQNGLNLTPVRRKVLEILLEKNTAIGAYEILDLLRESGFKNQPPVAYRALDFLVQNGFAHKIEQLNSFIGCMHPGKDHSPALLSKKPSLKREAFVNLVLIWHKKSI